MNLSNLQIELLKTFKYELSESQLLEIKQLLAGYFADKAAAEIDEFCEENGWDEQTIKDLSEQHLRTEYE